MNILENIPLKPYTNFRIGGPARFFCETKNTREIIESLKFAKERNMLTFILGLGANILVSDDGFPGLVIRQQNKKIRIEAGSRGGIITAKAGATIDKLIATALKGSLVGIEDFSEIPSTVGGALYINIHYFDAFIGPFVKSALVLNKNTLKVEEVDQSWFRFDYDNSKLKTDKDYILLEASFKLKQVDDYKKCEAIGKAKEIVRTRRRRYPSEPSVGSIFQNLSEEERRRYNLPTRSVAYLIDACGLKGKRIGDAMLSYQHANMIVNVGNARAADVLELAGIIKKSVREKFKIGLKFEMELVGF
jgi:UDP-N-acetylmuramate dehydrogenase